MNEYIIKTKKEENNTPYVRESLKGTNATDEAQTRKKEMERKRKDFRIKKEELTNSSTVRNEI